MKTKTNSLTYKVDTVHKGNHIFVSIRLDDKCKNGHQDFAITADIYEAGKPKTDRYYISGGCCHDEILKAFPEFKIFVNLHLCDYTGVPMYAVENGFYHLTNGFNNTPIESANFANTFCDYYRISAKQFNVLSQSKNKIQYALNLETLGILEQWKEEADNAIKMLENLTGKEFIVDSKRTQYNRPTVEEIQQEEERVSAGYYTKEAEAQRAEVKKAEIITKLQADRDKEINKANLEYNVKIAVLNAGGEKALNNCIFYTHKSELAINWKSYNMISAEAYNELKDKIQLPEGVTMVNKLGK